jgi:Mn-dependent DtxR family transcriptional regulator
MITAADSIDRDTLRIRHEFIVVPDRRASVSQIAAVLQIAPRHTLAALESLVTEQFLERTPDGHYVRATGTGSN